MWASSSSLHILAFGPEIRGDGGGVLVAGLTADNQQLTQVILGTKKIVNYPGVIIFNVTYK
jgi:hypothetical protein